MSTYLYFLHEDRFSSPRGDILDVGCADGSNALRLAEMGYNVIGIDLSSTHLKDGKRYLQGESDSGKLNIELIMGDAQHLPFKDGFFDDVFSMATFQYVPSKSKALKEFARVTKSKGKVIIDISNRYCLYYLGLNRLIHFVMPAIPTYAGKSLRNQKSSPSEMKKLFSYAGLSAIDIKPILLAHWDISDWLFNFMKWVDYIFETTPVLRKFMGVIVCKGVVTKNSQSVQGLSD